MNTNRQGPKAAQKNKEISNLTLYALRTVCFGLSKLDIKKIKKTLIKASDSKPASAFALKFNLTFTQLVGPGISKKQNNMVCLVMNPQHILLGINLTAVRLQLTLINGQGIKLQVTLLYNNY